jgi:hypothetical protein
VKSFPCETAMSPNRGIVADSYLSQSAKLD